MIQKNRSKEPKTIIFDIETFYREANNSPILCVAWKYDGYKKIHFDAIWNYPEWTTPKTHLTGKQISESMQNVDAGLIKKLWPVFSKADCLIGHFSRYFDIPFIKSRFIKHNLGCLPKHVVGDTWAAARNNLKLSSNRLKYVAKFLGVKEKIKQDDMSLWYAVQRNFPGAKKLMKKYNIRDVVSTQEVVNKLRGYMSIPQKIDKTRLDLGCPNATCKKPNMHSFGIVTRVSGLQYRRYRCYSCGSYTQIRLKTN